jgi:hypothetical protein
MLNAAFDGARALYLGNGDKKRVSCTEAALVIKNAKEQIYRYPINRIARIVSSASVDWSGAALALCMDRSISIAWLDSQGMVTGCLYSQQNRNSSFYTALELMLETHDGMLLYEHWLRSRRMHVMIHWAKTIPNPIAPHVWESIKREWVYSTCTDSHLPNGLREHCLAWVAAQLQNHDLRPVLLNPACDSVNLDQDLTYLLWMEMNLCCGPITEAAQTPAEMAQFFERWKARNGQALLVHLSSLHRSAMKASYTL